MLGVRRDYDSVTTEPKSIFEHLRRLHAVRMEGSMDYWKVLQRSCTTEPCFPSKHESHGRSVRKPLPVMGSLFEGITVLDAEAAFLR